MTQKYLLLVEDNPDDETLARRSCEKALKDVLLRVAHDGAEALSMLFPPEPLSHLKTPDLILLDLKLPKVSGFEVLRAIRENQSTCFTPVVVMSTSSENSDIERAYQIGANAFMRKPVSYEAFRDAMHMACHFWLRHNEVIARYAEAAS
ncbi:response regulator [Thermithiobacillus plumbiphilus]|uniref:Response regulator n=1 Tax=Thermithiobacillus plumbiphilus TaxID=1729899 RepID=A0ABU9DAV9_9PROT